MQSAVSRSAGECHKMKKLKGTVSKFSVPRWEADQDQTRVLTSFTSSTHLLKEKSNESLCCVDSRPSGWKHRHTVHNQQTRTRQDSQTVDQALRHIIILPAREMIGGGPGRARPNRDGIGIFLFVFFNPILDFKS